MQFEWKLIERPGFFGRSRDVKIALYNTTYGLQKWRLVWRANHHNVLFREACIRYYERSYLEYLIDRKDLLDWICSFGEVIDNAKTNISSGRDYEKQESYSTHIQDIAIRNVLYHVDRKFCGDQDNLLVVRGYTSSGHSLSPGQIPFYDLRLITDPSLAPGWAKEGSVEDFWQSNKWLEVLMETKQLPLLSYHGI